ncbi:MAG: PQQ-dependent sugar dehydrogenase [Alphaproteobacteria bacterium]|nr:PQQ-dependent sugar dehydrogenase [Alphaproteobacteria bacterium SS10]
MPTLFPHHLKALATLFVILSFAGHAKADDVQSRQVPGAFHEVKPSNLPAPTASPFINNPPLKIERPLRATLAVPEGFEATLFAQGLDNPRNLAVSPSGDVYVADSRTGRILALRDSDRNGRADRQAVIASGLARPHGLTFQGNNLYIADTHAVWRIPFVNGSPRSARPERITERGALGPADGHWSRNIIFQPDGERFFVSIGSRTNVEEDPTPRGTIQVFNADGTNQQSFASGLRNPVGMAIYPGSDSLFTVVQERTGLGDGLVPDFLTEVVEDGFYGWPYAYIGTNPQPGLADTRPDKVASSLTPDLLFATQSSPTGLTFYTGTQFPVRYRGGAFVTLRGSSAKTEPTGYKVVFVPFNRGTPSGGYETFISGWWQLGPQALPRSGRFQARIWGRPTGIAETPDGSLLIADDTGGDIWLIRYIGG